MAEVQEKMLQSINLYRHLQQKEELRFSAKQGLIASAVLAAVMLVASAGLAVNSNLQGEALVQIQQERDDMQQTLANLQANAERIASSDTIERLRNEIDAKRSLLASVGDGSEPAFSEYMAGLGRQHVRGLWLETVAVKRRGEQIAISGSMNKASLLPRYLQQLGNESIFRGVRFQLMKIEELPLEQQQMRFEVAVASEEHDTQGSES